MSDTFARIVEANRTFARTFPGSPSVRPRMGLAVVTCMDARIDVLAVLGLEAGDAHVLRNAGGIVTDDVIRSICLSQRLLGTHSIALVHHTDCGVHGLSDDHFTQTLAEETGHIPRWRPGGFPDVDESVRTSIRRLVESPFLLHRDAIVGFVYDTESGLLVLIEEDR